MIKKSGLNGILQQTQQAAASETERIAANVDYIAMMCDVDIPTEEGGGGDEQEV